MAHPAAQMPTSSVRFDDEPVARRIGLIALSTDHTSEREFARICDPGEVGVYVTRIAFDNPTTPESLKRTGPRLSEAAALILPEERLDVVAYGCTAASVVLGNEAIAEFIRQAKPGVACVTPTTAAFAAFAALGVTRLSILTPYLPEVTAELADYFEGHGLDVANTTSLGIADDRQMARVAPESIVEAAVEAVAPEAEALFISCTALRAAGVAEEIEARIEKPVVTSNQAVVWQCLRLAGIERTIPGYGRLFTLGLPTSAN